MSQINARARMTPQRKHAQNVNSDVDWLKSVLTSLALRGFHGKITLNYEKGKLKNMVEERSHKPPS